jgi:hypothetical protein
MATAWRIVVLFFIAPAARPTVVVIVIATPVARPVVIIVIVIPASPTRSVIVVVILETTSSDHILRLALRQRNNQEQKQRHTQGYPVNNQSDFLNLLDVCLAELLALHPALEALVRTVD